MARLRQGDGSAAERLVEVFYPELRRMAAGRMRGERSGHTWQPTVLVNELYLELRKIKQLRSDASKHALDERSAFLALAAHIMKRLLVEHARTPGVRLNKLPLSPDICRDTDGDATLGELDDVLGRLERVNPKLARVVEMKVWEGLTADQIAERLNCTSRSVDRYWSLARQWLRENYV